MSAIDVPDLHVPATAEAASGTERPIFVAEGPRRRRIVRAAAVTMAVLGVTWLCALIAGGFGLGRRGGTPPLGRGEAQPREAPPAARRTTKPAAPHVRAG